MPAGVVRFVAAVLAIVLMSGCGSSLEERRPDEPLAKSTGLRESRTVFVPVKPLTQPRAALGDAELVTFLETVVPEVWGNELEVEWRRIVADARFHSLRSQRSSGQYQLILTRWTAGGSRLHDITTGYEQWCGSRSGRGHCVSMARSGSALTDAEVYKIGFDFAMGASWDGFTQELKGMVQPSTLRVIILTGLVVFMACIAIPELTTKIPVAIATALLTAYLGAQAVCDLVFGWFRMVRELDAATSFVDVRDAGERYGRLIGAETARILIMLAMAAISEGGVIARLMDLPRVGAASAALAADTGGTLGAISEVSGAKVLQGGVSITVEGVAQAAGGVAMGARGGAPKVATTFPLRPPRKPVDIELKYKEEWTPQQRADARTKIKKLNEAEDKVVVRNTKRSSFSASARFRADGNEIPPGCDIDHCVDLQLNGNDTLENMWPLDSSVNRSLGSQIHHAIKDLPVGTPIGRISIN